MAQTDAADNSSDLKGEQPAVSQGTESGSSGSNVVKIREPFEIGGLTRIIYDISTDGGMKRTFGWKIREGSRVLIHGSNLGVYSQVNLHVAGNFYLHRGIDRSPDGRLLGFSVSSELAGLYAEGQGIEMELVDPSNIANNRYLFQKFRYTGPKQEDKETDKAKKAAGAAEESRRMAAGSKDAGLISRVIDRTIGGVPEAVVSGMSGGVPAAAGGAQGASSKSKNAGVAGSQPADDFDSDEVELSGASAQAAEAGAEAETFAQARMETSQAATGGGTDSGEVVAETGSGASGSVGAQIQTNASVNARAETEAGAKISQAAEVEAKIGGASVRGAAEAGGVSREAEISASNQASVSARGNAETSSEINASVSEQAQSGTGLRAEPRSAAGGKATAESGISGSQVSAGGEIGAKAQTQFQGHYQVPGQAPAASATAGAGAQVSGETQAESEQAPEDAGAGAQGAAAEQSQPGLEAGQPPAAPLPQDEPAEAKESAGEPEPGQALSGKGQIDGVNKTGSGSAPQKDTGPKTPPGIRGALNKFGANDALLKSKLGQGAGPAQVPAAGQHPGKPAGNLMPPAASGKGGSSQAGGEAEDQNNPQTGEQAKKSGSAAPAVPVKPQGASAAGLETGGGVAEGAKQAPDAQGESGEPETGGRGDETLGPDSENQEPQRQPDQIFAARNAAAKQQAELAEAEKLVNKAVNTYLQVLARAVWVSAIPTLGLSVLLGAVVGDFLWLLKDWAVRQALKAAPLPAKLKKYAAADLKIKFSLSIKIQIVAMNLIVAAAATFIFVFVLSLLWGICNSWWTAYPVNKWGLQPACEYINKTQVGGTLSSLRSSGSYVASYNTPGGLISTSKWTEQINSAAQKWNIDACILRVVVQKESGGAESAIGCDCAANGHPDYCPDKRKTYSSDYQFNWAQCSYGIGLAQWTIYPAGGSGYKAWQSPNLPSRNLYSGWYGVSDFLNPTISLDLTAQAFSTNLAKANGDVSAAFAAYVGASSLQNHLVADRMALYNLCKQNPSTGGGSSGGGGASDSWDNSQNNQGISLNSLIKPWPGPDPYPAVDWGSLDMSVDSEIKTKLGELKIAFAALNTDWQNLGRGELKLRQVYRPQAYTDHYRSIWEISAILKGKDYTVGYRCNEVNHLDPAQVRKLTAEQIQSLQAEFNRHQVGGPTPAGCVSDHSSGIALDIDSPNSSLYSGSLYVSLMQEANKYGLCHNIPGDQPHYSLTKYLSSGTDCFQK